MAKAILDQRVMDIQLHPLFLSMLLDGDRYVALLSMHQLYMIDAQLASSLQHLLMIKEDNDRTAKRTISDMGLTFTLPGYENISLLSDMTGSSHLDLKSKILDEDNVISYCNAVLHWSLCEGIQWQVSIVREAFESILPLRTLATLFSPTELLMLISGDRLSVGWPIELLQEVIEVEHGYTCGSPIVRWFLRLLADLNLQERKLFLRFLTGSGTLPVGGWRALKPRLTIVKKVMSPTLSANTNTTSISTSTSSTSASSTSTSSTVTSTLFRTSNGYGPCNVDDMLPSVTTCMNYLKLPDYSSETILRERLLCAIREGQSSFDLS
jgi:E3 ubiquitin-protein ligase TRIP12